jgi:hypothetical protein
VYAYDKFSLSIASVLSLKDRLPEESTSMHSSLVHMYVRLDLGHKFKMQIHIVSFLAHFCLLDGAKK